MHRIDDSVVCWVTVVEMWVGILVDLIVFIESMM